MASAVLALTCGEGSLRSNINAAKGLEMKIYMNKIDQLVSLKFEYDFVDQLVSLKFEYDFVGLLNLMTPVKGSEPRRLSVYM